MKAVWIGVIALSALALAATWSVWGATCIDGAGFARCDSEPVVSWAGAGIVTVIAVSTMIVAVAKLRRTPPR